MKTGSKPIVPIYWADIRRLVNDAFDGPAPVPVVVPVGSIGSRATLIEHWLTDKAERANRPPRLFFDRKGQVGSGIDPEGELELVTAREYYPSSLPYRCFVNAVLLDLATDENLPETERVAIEDAIIREYDKQEHLLLPPSVLMPIARAAKGPLRKAFLDFLEQARTAVLSEAVPLDEAIKARAQYRVQALRHGADGVLTEPQVTVAEAVIDILLLQRACLADVRRAEASRGSEPRYRVIKRLDDNTDFAFEHVLPTIVRPRPIEEAIPEADRERIEAFAQGRPHLGPDGILRLDWHPRTDLPVPPVLVRTRARPKERQTLISAARESEHSLPPIAPQIYNAMRQQITSRVVGHEEAVDRLALAALLHQHGTPLQRLLICGRPGSGKTHLARAAAEAAGCPFHLCDASAIVETGYHGMGMGEVLEGAYAAAGRDLESLEQSVLVLDEIDKLRCPPDLTGVSRDKRLGQQYALLTLLGGGTPVSINNGNLQVRTEMMLIIAAGAFSETDWSGIREPTTEDLVAYGFVEELAERLTERIVLRPRSASEYVQLFAEGVTGVATVCQQAGYALVVPDETLRYVARAVAEGRSALGPRSGNSALVQAARRLFIRALRSDAPAGSVITLSPDDVVLPARPRASRM